VRLSRRPSPTCPTKTTAWDLPAPGGRNAPCRASDLQTMRRGAVSEKIKLMVEPGRRQTINADGDNIFEFVGVPFGSHARLILLYPQTEALRTGRREVELGGSMRGWLARVGIPPGGMRQSHDRVRGPGVG